VSYPLAKAITVNYTSWILVEYYIRLSVMEVAETVMVTETVMVMATLVKPVMTIFVQAVTELMVLDSPPHH